ncbi:uncharacterized WD repeat-containing protein alr2800-like [Aricia agestis]|uniref:uncharacterized WD repeat-containing protein alr2800-like n=1 Tax=Aricia agestis TaxID=91739 RepID=UPI001C207C79|nr:uncharacterized WD repeat-containing protein alr2800-like [Aricia agestis]
MGLIACIISTANDLEPAVSAVRVTRGEVTCADAGAWPGAGLLAAGSGDGQLRLWRWQRGAGWTDEKATRAHRYGVTCARFSEGGRLLASAGVDGAARIWAARELTERRELAAPDAAAARALVWAGGRLAVGHDDGAVRVWTSSGALLCCVRPHEGAVHALATLSANALLLTGCTEGVLKVFDFDERERDILLCASKSAMQTFASFSANALLLTGCTEGVLKVFDFDALTKSGIDGGSGPPPLIWEDGAHDLGLACAASAHKMAATGGRDGRIRLWTVLGGGRERRVVPDGVLTGHTDAVTALYWARDMLASASQDRTARIWDPQSSSCVRVLHAHKRYLTAVVVAADLRYIITGSNDKSVRTWSLGSFSIDDDIEPECNPMSHFALGDLEGIGPVDDAAILEGEELEDNIGSETTKSVCVWTESCGTAVNCIAASGDLFAAACSDGWVRIYQVSADGSRVVHVRSLDAHTYPAMAVDFGAGGDLLLSAGLDASVRLWDVKSGCELATLMAEGVCGEGAGGGGVRGARLSPRRLLLASDNGAAAVWDIDPLTNDPTHVYGDMAEAATCCCWAGGDLLAVGGAAGDLRLCRPPPDAAEICCQTDAHDLGVLSCDFAPDFEDGEYILASGGRDALVKLWRAGTGLKLLSSLPAHAGAVHTVRWGGNVGGARVLATGGADRWARVWRVSGGRAVPLAAVAARGAGGAGAVQPMGQCLVVGSLSGELALWSLPSAALSEDDAAEPREWVGPAVARWITEYVTRYPGSTISLEDEIQLLERVREAALTGARLLDDPLEELLEALGCGGDDEDESELTTRLRDEILWLRRDLLPYDVEASAPHALRCPLSHRVVREPVRAADGFTYDRATLSECLLAQGDDMRSPMTGRRLVSALVEPNYGVREQLKLLYAEYR